MAEIRNCYRFPCDTAYRRGGHPVRHDGRVVHYVSVYDGEGWSVGVIAAEDDPWRLALRTTRGGVDLDPKEAERLATKTTLAAMWATSYRLQDVERELSATKEDLLDVVRGD